MSAAVCPVVGTTTNVLPPHHPEIQAHSEARCPVTNAKVEHHDNIIHNTHSDIQEPGSDKEAMDASQCPAMKSAANNGESITDALCPVVGAVNSHLPPQHPALNEKEAGAICPVTNASLEHHKTKVLQHKAVAKSADASQCPVAGAKA
ncbi:hypothetical protein Slin15195_G027750 [Septoria linicola]|uniref:Uncharacterized protein n=1 Tax=Septoria linicola TaxID=215465 RepID=A0A9Q9EF55_9PEZI|nr:hypothetical protein Slin14017_G026790 [Septoria linicola]USW49456.1 hypothetical protein Slin15195_G027750 [Septoria linicola]